MTRSEAQTRTELIDRQLAQSGWNVNDPTQVVEEYDIPTSAPDGVAESVPSYGSHQFSDYVLLGKDGKPLAVVEAKRTGKDAAIGREQAKQYCYNIQNRIGGELPFCFYTNGHDLDSLCDRLGPLMKFRERENPGANQVHLNLADKLHNKEMVEFGPSMKR